MALTANLRLVVPALPDTDTWFLNSAAWTTYWQNIQMTATFQPATTVAYVSTPYNNALQPYYLNIDGSLAATLITQTMFTSLLTQLSNLDTSYQALRAQLVAAGFISNA